jgi:hypothetical protein
MVSAAVSGAGGRVVEMGTGVVGTGAALMATEAATVVATGATEGAIVVRAVEVG